MSCNCIEMWLLPELLYVLVRILERIDHGVLITYAIIIVTVVVVVGVIWLGLVMQSQEGYMILV